MELTLQDIARIAPGLVSRVRQDIRHGRLAAERRRGMAGRPYVITEQTLMQAGYEGYRELVERARQVGLASEAWQDARGKRGEGRFGVLGGWPGEDGWRALWAMLEEERGLVRAVVDALTRELERQHERGERDRQQIQELTYQLGQARQELARWERPGRALDPA
jgi:hypothetical protein